MRVNGTGIALDQFTSSLQFAKTVWITKKGEATRDLFNMPVPAGWKLGKVMAKNASGDQVEVDLLTPLEVTDCFEMNNLPQPLGRIHNPDEHLGKDFDSGMDKNLQFSDAYLKSI